MGRQRTRKPPPQRQRRAASLWPQAAAALAAAMATAVGCWQWRGSLLTWSSDAVDVEAALAELQRWIEQPWARPLPMNAAWSGDDRALRLLTLLSSSAPTSPEVWSALAVALSRAGRPSEASHAFAEAARMPPASLQRIAAARQHNLEAVAALGHGLVHEDPLPSGPSGAGGWPERTLPSGHGASSATSKCAIDIRSNMSMRFFEEHYVRSGR